MKQHKNTKQGGDIHTISHTVLAQIIGQNVGTTRSDKSMCKYGSALRLRSVGVLHQTVCEGKTKKVKRIQ